MTTTLVDANILLDLVSDDPAWGEWSTVQLRAARLRGTIAINDIVYAEVSVGVPSIEALGEFLTGVGIALLRVPHAALFLAGRAFRDYRAAGGRRTGVLPDLFIGAHAVVAGMPLLTRDNKRFRAYFPTITLIAPGNAN